MILVRTGGVKAHGAVLVLVQKARREHVGAQLRYGTDALPIPAYGETERIMLEPVRGLSIEQFYYS